MLSSTGLQKVQEILQRMSKGQPVSFSERAFLRKQADKDQTVASWLFTARRMQQNIEPEDGIDKLLSSLNLGSPDPGTSFQPEDEDLGEWFSGAPSWLGRS